jgi:tRNA G18 (ribose-2'-O)-methylase SpoU
MRKNLNILGVLVGLAFISGMLPAAAFVITSRRIGGVSKVASLSSSKTFDDPEASYHYCTRRKRTALLQESLDTLQIDASDLHKAAMQSLERPEKGYDGRYGKSALKTYRAFVYPKKDTVLDEVQTAAAAVRCARQIEFLLRRHKSHETAWIRHHDGVEETASRSFPIMLLLDNVRSAANVGSLFRTADATGCCQVLTTGITPHPGGSGADKLRKSALGAEELVPHRHFVSTAEAVHHIREHHPGCAVVGMETTAHSLPYTDYVYNKAGVVLVLGNEVTGVEPDLLAEMDAVVEIPVFGSKNSLNVAASAPVVLYEIIRQWTADKK